MTRDPPWVAIAAWAGAALLVVAMIGHTTNHLWAFDFWWYLAAVREFAEHGFAATHPLVTDASDDPYLNPYTFTLGLITAIGWWEASTTLVVAAIANLGLLLTGLVRFATAITGRAIAGPLLVIATLLFWGLNPWRFAGFFNLNALGYVLPLGSTFAAALALLLLAALRRWQQGDHRGRHLVTVAGCTPLILLVHPMTATWTAAIAVGFVLAAPLRERATWIPVAVAAGGAALALLWPYYPVTEIAANAAAFNASNAAMFRDVLTRTVLALPGVVILVVRLAHRRRDPLALGFAIVAGLYAVAWVTGTFALGRVLPGVVLCAHMAIVDAGLRWWDRRPSFDQQKVVGLALVGMVVIGAVGVAPGAMRSVPRDWLPERYRADPRLASTVEPALDTLPGPIWHDDVMLASPGIGLLAAAHAGKLLAPPAGRPAPFFDDDDLRARRMLVTTLLNPMTPDDERDALLEELDVRWLVLTLRDHEILGAMPWAAGPTVVETDTFVVVPVTGPPADP